MVRMIIKSEKHVKKIGAVPIFPHFNQNVAICQQGHQKELNRLVFTHNHTRDVFYNSFAQTEIQDNPSKNLYVL
jgi:hypothetical protein